MPTLVSLKAVVAELDWYSEESVAYLHKPTGKVVVVERELLAMVEEGQIPMDDEGDDDGETPPEPPADTESEPDELSHAFGIVQTDEYVPFPSRNELNEWQIMADFVEKLPTGPVRRGLASAIHGSGAFGRFGRGVDEHGLTERRHDHRDAAYKRFVEGWLRSLGMDYVDDFVHRGED